jgi:prepilin-type N-terminal cleavage/methylation domain-containing protein
MMRSSQRWDGAAKKRLRGFTLVEVLIALAICGLAMAAIVSGYLCAASAAEKSALSLAANASAMRRVEESRCARWVISTYPPIDEVVQTNFPDTVVVLDLPGSGSAVTYATNSTVISLISTNPPFKRVRVDCVWAFRGNRLFTNSVETCRAPDQ